jgi:hypothetical protein
MTPAHLVSSVLPSSRLGQGNPRHSVLSVLRTCSTAHLQYFALAALRTFSTSHFQYFALSALRTFSTSHFQYCAAEGRIDQPQAY